MITNKAISVEISTLSILDIYSIISSSLFKKNISVDLGLQIIPLP